MTCEASWTKRRNAIVRRTMCPIMVITSLLTGCAVSQDRPGAEHSGQTNVQASRSDKTRAHLVELGRHALDARDYRDAYTNFSRALSLKGDDPEALIGLGESYLGARNLKEAVEAFEKAQRIESVRALALQGQGLALAMMGQGEASRARLQAAVDADPNLWRAWNALGRRHDLLGDWSQAEAVYARALQLNPMAAEIYNNRGVSLLLQKRYADASAAFEAALDVDPGLQEAQENHRLALAFAGRYLEAVADISPGRREKVLNNVGYAAMQRQDFAAAEKFLTEAIGASAAYYVKAAENLEELRIRRNLSLMDRSSPRLAAALTTRPVARLPEPPLNVVESQLPEPATAKQAEATIAPVSLTSPSLGEPTLPAADQPVAFVTSAGASTQPESPDTVPAASPNAPLYRIQLGAARSEAEARAEWPRLQKAHDVVLDRLSLNIERAEIGTGSVVYRIQAGPLPDRAAAVAACGELLSRKVPCRPVQASEP